MDKVSSKKRSLIMRQVKSQGTKLEDMFFKKLWHLGLRYRKHPKGLYGKPDLAIKKYKVVIFIDSCFWHGCSQHLRMPKSNRDYWEDKIKRNKERDKEVNRYYRDKGWKLIRVWEHDIKEDIDKVAKRVHNEIIS